MLNRRLQVSGEIGDALMAASGGSYGFLIVTQRAATGEHAQRVVEKIVASLNDLISIEASLDRLISEAQKRREARRPRPPTVDAAG